MTKSDWITLTDYSGKYRVSVSTLRRRIKDKTAEYRFDEGKYWLRDLPLKMHSTKDESKNKASIAPPQGEASSKTLEPSPDPNPLIQDLPLNQGADSSSQVWATAQSLLQEIKKAYMVILQEKEEQIIQLKEEVTDLKTLVRVLEQNNERLSKATGDGQHPPQSNADWMFSLDK